MTTEHKSTTSQPERKGNTFADWQPIETAPKDGEWVLLSGCDFPLPDMARWSFGYWWSLDGNTIDDATHWAYLPPPPASEEQ